MRSGLTLWARFTLRTLFALGTRFTLWALIALRTYLSLWARFTLRTLFALGTRFTLWALIALRTYLSLWARFTLWTLFALGTRFTLRSSLALWSPFSLRARFPPRPTFTLWSSFSLRTRFSLWADLALRALLALGTSFTLRPSLALRAHALVGGRARQHRPAINSCAALGLSAFPVNMKYIVDECFRSTIDFGDLSAVLDSPQRKRKCLRMLFALLEHIWRRAFRSPSELVFEKRIFHFYDTCFAGPVDIARGNCPFQGHWIRLNFVN